MEFYRCTVDDCHRANGVVVVIDVLRAFTTAAWAFNRGAKDIVLTTTVGRAFELRDGFPGSLIMGEVDALPVPGFDLPNSPTAVSRADIKGHRLIHRTTAGTQGACRATKAKHLYAAGLVNAAATANRILELQPDNVTFVETGRRKGDPGDEDVACADYVQALLEGSAPDTGLLLERVSASLAGARFADPAQPEFPDTDLALAQQVDRFNFALQVLQEDGLAVLRKTVPADSGSSE